MRIIAFINDAGPNLAIDCGTRRRSYSPKAIWISNLRPFGFPIRCPAIGALLSADVHRKSKTPADDLMLDMDSLASLNMA